MAAPNAPLGIVVLDGFLHALPRDVLDNVYQRLDRVTQRAVHRSCHAGRVLTRRNALALTYGLNSAAAGATPDALLQLFSNAARLRYCVTSLSGSSSACRSLHPKLLHLEVNAGQFTPGDIPALGSLLLQAPNLECLGLGSPDWLVYAFLNDFKCSTPFTATAANRSSCGTLLDALASLTRLTSLTLGGSGVQLDNCFFASLPNLTSLRTLHLDAMQAADPSESAFLGRLTTVTSLTLRNYSSTPLCLPTSLRSIHLLRDLAAPDHLQIRRLASLPRIESIATSGAVLDISDLPTAPSPTLTHLSLKLPTSFSVLALRNIGPLSYLRSLDLHCHLPCRLSVVLVAFLSLPSLTRLLVSDMHASFTMSSNIFTPLCVLPALQSLTLQTDKSPPCDFHDPFPQTPNPLPPHITTLNLPWLRITPVHWSALSSLPSLQSLSAATLTLPPSPLPPSSLTSPPPPPSPASPSSPCTSLLPTLPALLSLTTTNRTPLDIPTTDAILCTLTSSARNLRHLSLGNCSAVTAVGLHLLSTSCPSLQHLALFNLSSHIPPVGLLPLARLRSLAKLYLQLPWLRGTLCPVAAGAPSLEAAPEYVALEEAAWAVGARVFLEAAACIVVKDAAYVPGTSCYEEVLVAAGLEVEPPI